MSIFNQPSSGTEDGEECEHEWTDWKGEYASEWGANIGWLFDEGCNELTDDGEVKPFFSYATWESRKCRKCSQRQRRNEKRYKQYLKLGEREEIE